MFSLAVNRVHLTAEYGLLAFTLRPRHRCIRDCRVEPSLAVSVSVSVSVWSEAPMGLFIEL